MPTATARGSSRSCTSCTPIASSSRSRIAAAASTRRRPRPPMGTASSPRAASGSRSSRHSRTSSSSAKASRAARGCASSSASAETLVERRTLIVVSNRGPVTYLRDAAGERVARRGGGGLVTALRGLRERHDVTWIAAATTDEDRVVAAEGAGESVFVTPDRDTYHGYYNVVANPVLWFLQHGLWGRALRPELDRAFHEAWRDYEE